MLMHATVVLCHAALVLSLLAAPALPQGDPKPPAPAPTPAPQEKPEKLPKWRIDPYTKNKPELMAKAGYVSFGPFPFGTIAEKPVQTSQIDESIENVQILWIETAHFRIGSNLPKFTVPEEASTRAKIRTELEMLATKLPGINAKVRTLDPWLRAHMMAQRLERLYDETQTLFGVKTEDFPTDASKVVRTAGARFMGYGPYLGMRDKYLVLVFEKMGPYASYMKTYLGRDSKFGQRWHFKEASAILFTIATECDDARNKDDTALHCCLGFNVGQNLLDGFRYYSYDLPVWIREGYGHWVGRKIDPRFNDFDQNEGSTADMKTTWNWEPYVRNLVTTNGKFAPFADIYTWRDFGNITFNDHTAIWSRIDWLMSQGPEKWQKFLFLIKGRVDAQWLPDQNDLVGATRDALKEVYGVGVLDFDLKWAAWVKTTYPSQ
jgi:hypothetical protein